MKLITLFLAAMASTFCKATELKMGGVVLMQPEYVLQERGIAASDLADYIRSAQAASENALRAVKLPPSSGFLVLAVREGNKSNAWTDFHPVLPVMAEDRLIQAIRKIPPFKVANGTVIFAVQLMVNGAAAPVEPLPRPAAWLKAMENSNASMEVEELVRVVWP